MNSRGRANDNQLLKVQFSSFNLFLSLQFAAKEDVFIVLVNQCGDRFLMNLDHHLEVSNFINADPSLISFLKRF